jgi:hypothetical protein
MMNSRIIRKFERFLFKGIPEQPESTYERDGNTYATIRETGRSSVKPVEEDGKNFTEVGVFTYDFDKGIESYHSCV